MKHLAPSAHFNYKNRSMRAFTLPELAVVIVVLAILMAASYFGFSTWRDRVAETELKSDLTGVAAAMDSARNWSKGYPELADGVTFDGSEATKAIFTQSEHVILTYYEGTDKEYCIDAVSKARPSIAMFYNSTDTDKEPKKGTCLGGEGYVPNPNQTIFVYDTRLANCNGTVQLPITSPTSAPGSTITWGDGQTSSLTSSLQSHTYSTPGRYMVTYEGGINRVEAGGTAVASRGCLKEVRQWGNGAAPTRVQFAAATNLSYVAEPPHTVADMSAMFNADPNFNQAIGDWDVSNVTNMNSMFKDATGFNQALNSWNIGNVTDMGFMFSGAGTFNQPLNSWNTSKVTNMSSMFTNAVAFNQPIGSWDTSKVTNMTQMLRNTRAFNQPIGNWNTSNVLTMDGLFLDATSFNQPIGNWNTSKVTDMKWMFRNQTSLTYSFNQPIGNWNVSNVTNMESMFANSSFTAGHAFNQPLNTWNVSKVTNMDSMFLRAQSFNQPLNSWNTSKVTNMNSMFSCAGSATCVFNQNLSSWNVSLVTPKPPSSFDSGAPAWTLPRPVW